MKFFAPAIIVSSLLFASVSAKAETFKFNADQAYSVFTGLSSLDGYDSTYKDGALEHPIKRYYEFGPGLRLLIARNISKLRDVITAYQTAHQASVTANGSDEKKIAVDDMKIRQETQDITLDTIKVDELKLDKNQIPASILSLLTPILKD